MGHPFATRVNNPGSMVLELGTNPQGLLKAVRRDIIGMAAHSSHVATALSCVEILAALYGGGLRLDGPARDRLIFSKGHGCMALYAVLAHCGFFPREWLDTYSQNGSPLAEHPMPGRVPGIDFAAGSLGHGLAAAAGWAEAFRLQGAGGRVFAVLGDGECQEGAVWEAAALAAARELGALAAIVDANGLQACGKCGQIARHMSLPGVWAAHGWTVEECDGHDVAALRAAFADAGQGTAPTVFICHTVKGKGVDFMEGDLEYHYRPIRGKERDEALRRLEDA